MWLDKGDGRENMSIQSIWNKFYGKILKMPKFKFNTKMHHLICNGQTDEYTEMNWESDSHRLVYEKMGLLQIFAHTSTQN